MVCSMLVGLQVFIQCVLFADILLQGLVSSHLLFLELLEPGPVNAPLMPSLESVTYPVQQIKCNVLC